MWWGSLATWTRRHWCCGPMCHSRSGWGSGRHVRLENLAAERQKTQTNWLLMWSDQWEDAHECRKREKGREDVRKLFDSGFIHIHGVLWRTDALLNEVFWEKEKLRWSLPLVLCARAKPSSIRKKSIHTRGNTEDISLCNNPAVQCWSYGNQQNRSKIIYSAQIPSGPGEYRNFKTKNIL